MRILYLTFYFEPDLSAGSFRNTSLLKAIKSKITKDTIIDVITTMPNRYGSYNVEISDEEQMDDNISIKRVVIPRHNNGIVGQIKTFKTFYFQAFKLAKKNEYNLVYASSSRLFTAFLGARLSNTKGAKLYLDIRDIFRETIMEVYENILLRTALNLVIKPLEEYTFKSADHINLVSEGFSDYFKKYDASFSYYTNGIDTIFLEDRVKKEKTKSEKVITYAGNIGQGQGLHLIIPQLAKALGEGYLFKIIGDGGAKNKLISELQQVGANNVELLEPVTRVNLIKEYENADFLFLHLNKYKAFKRVLPSKLFEYAAFNKPIIAGVSGYSANFIKEKLDNVLLFEPGDINSIIQQLRNYKEKFQQRDDFVEEFSREKINNRMSDSILNLVK